MKILGENWVIENLQRSLDIWNDKFHEILTLVTQSPTEFRGGAIWNTISNIHGALQAVGLALLVLFFVSGVIKTCGSFSEIKRPEQVLKLFVRFALAKGIITYGMDLMLSIFNIVQGIIRTVMNTAGLGTSSYILLPSSIITAVDSLNFLESIPLWAVSLIGSLIIMVLSFIMILSVYGRFFKLYMYTAVAPIPLSTFAGEPTQNIGKSFIKSFCAVCLEGAVIILACIIYSSFASSPPVVDVSSGAVTQVWSYLGELVFNMLVLVGTVRMSDNVIKDMFGI